MRRLIVVFLLPCLAACVSSEVQATPQPSQTLRSYQSQTPSPSAAPRVVILTPRVTPLPTPTPLTHIIEAGETLIAIAIRYGVSVAELLVANPGVTPRLLRIGEALIIPSPDGGGVGAVLPTATPVPVALTEVQCYPESTGGLWCWMVAQVGAGGPIEGLVGVISLLDREGEVQASEFAYPLLNRVRPGELGLLAAYFSPPRPGYTAGSGTLISAIPSRENGDRYPSVRVSVTDVLPGSDDSRWAVRGEVEVAEGADRVVVLVLALDESGAVVGYVKWEAPLEGAEGARRPFTAQVFSLGPPIAELAVYAEALSLR